MTELQITFDESAYDGDGLNISLCVVEDVTSTPMEKECALLVSKSVNRELRAAAQLASLRHAEEGVAQ